VHIRFKDETTDGEGRDPHQTLVASGEGSELPQADLHDE